MFAGHFAIVASDASSLADLKSVTGCLVIYPHADLAGEEDGHEGGLYGLKVGCLCSFRHYTISYGRYRD